MLMTTSRFIGERIAVTCGGEISEPVALEWQGREYRVENVLAAWSDWGFSAGALQRNWRTRRHRNYYRVQLSTGETFELYRDRGPRGEKSEWYLYQIIEP